MDARIHPVLGAEELGCAVITANRTCLHVTYVAAGAQAVIACSDNDDCLYLGIEIPGIELLLDRHDHAGGQRITCFRPIERDPPDAAVDGEFDVSHGHTLARCAASLPASQPKVMHGPRVPPWPP